MSEKSGNISKVSQSIQNMMKNQQNMKKLSHEVWNENEGRYIKSELAEGLIGGTYHGLQVGGRDPSLQVGGPGPGLSTSGETTSVYLQVGEPDLSTLPRMMLLRTMPPRTMLPRTMLPRTMLPSSSSEEWWRTETGW